MNKTIEDRLIAIVDKYVPTAQVVERNEDQYVPYHEDVHLSLKGYQAMGQRVLGNIDTLK
ncbi:hypothetical protein AAAC51_19105 [Priestia megaterium]